nr:MAG TPA_asm: hypothetical protein [Bacteriophage sp.]
MEKLFSSTQVNLRKWLVLQQLQLTLDVVL